MNVARYIGLFLLKNEQCYVHGLGTLQLLRKAATYDGQSLQPYWYEIAISAGGNVDESLANFIANNEQISISKATGSLKDYSTETQNRLKAGEEVELPHLGKFTWNDGRISFITASHLQYKSPAISAQKGVSLKHNERPEGQGKKFVLPTAPINSNYGAEQQPIAPPMPQVRQYMQKPQEEKEKLNWARILFVLILLPVLAALTYYGYMRYLAPKKAIPQTQPALKAPETVEEIVPITNDTTTLDTTMQPIDTLQVSSTITDTQKTTKPVVTASTELAPTKQSPAATVSNTTKPPIQDAAATKAQSETTQNVKWRNLRVVIHTSDNKEGAYSLKRAAEGKGNKVEVLEEDVNYYFVVVSIKTTNSNNNRVEDSVSKIYNVEQAFVY